MKPPLFRHPATVSAAVLLGVIILHAGLLYGSARFSAREMTALHAHGWDDW